MHELQRSQSRRGQSEGGAPRARGLDVLSGEHTQRQRLYCITSGVIRLISFGSVVHVVCLLFNRLHCMYLYNRISVSFRGPGSWTMHAISFRLQHFPLLYSSLVHPPSTLLCRRPPAPCPFRSFPAAPAHSITRLSPRHRQHFILGVSCRCAPSVRRLSLHVCIVLRLR